MLVAILDDNRAEAGALGRLCERFGARRGLEVETALYTLAADLLDDPAARAADIYFFDIMMEGAAGYGPAGVDVARRLRQGGCGQPMVFVTASREYYPEGFEVGVVHYLLKPPAYADVEQAMERALRLLPREERVISVPVNRVRTRVNRDDIIYAEVYGRETVLNTTGGTLKVRLPLQDLEKMLDGPPFLRCFRSCLINMDYVASLADDHFVMQNGGRIPISVKARQRIKESYISYRFCRVREMDG